MDLPYTVEPTFQLHLQWYSDNLRIRTSSGRIEPFVLFPHQEKLERYRYECLLEGKPCHIIVLKARQEGVSTWAEAALFRQALQMEEQRLLVIAHTEDASRNLFGMTKRYYDHLPNKPETTQLSARSMKFDHNNSEFIVQTAGSGGNVGRSFTLSGVHFSEVDFYPNPDDLFIATLQTLHGEPGELIIIESTADGPMKFLNRVWTQAVEGRSSFKPVFFSWHDFAKYQRPISWDDLKAYAPREWVSNNRVMIRRGMENVDQHEGKGKSGSGGTGGSGVGGSVDSAASGKGDTAGSGKRDQASKRAKSNAKAKSKRKAKSKSGEPSGRSASSDRRRDSDRDEGNVGSKPAHVYRSVEGEGVSGRSAGAAPYGARRNADAASVDRPAGTSLPDFAFGLETAFQDSLDDKELSNQLEFELTLEQINWRRFVLETKCVGDETKMRREYPARPEEAFEASGGDILDQRVLAQWAKAADDTPPKARIRMSSRERNTLAPIIGYELEDRTGKVEIYHWPDESPQESRPGKFTRKYVMGVDCSQGTSDGDWTVAVVLDVDSGEQVAEFRARMDPDLAIDQIEWLGLFYNNALTAIEITGGHGGPFVRHIHNRGWLKLYERKTYDRGIQSWTKKPGWDTTTKTRPALVSESKIAVRQELCKLNSKETIRECRLLWENNTGKVEARPGFHDDGWIAYAITLMVRNEVLGLESLEVKEDRSKEAFLQVLDARAKAKEEFNEDRFSRITANLPTKVTFVGGGQKQRPDGRRSWL